MLLAKLRESLTVRLFCLTFAIVLAAATTTFGLIALVTPVSYTAVLTDQITQRLDQLLDTLAETDFDDAIPILADFILDCDVEVELYDPTGSQLIFHGLYEDNSMVATGSDYSVSTTYATTDDCDRLWRFHRQHHDRREQHHCHRGCLSRPGRAL